MAPEPLNILQKGLQVSKKNVKARKEKLEAQLAKNGSISAPDRWWLDNEANVIDEERVLELLENASDYERGVGRLDEKGKEIVKTLRERAGDLIKVPGRKRKRSEKNIMKMRLKLQEKQAELPANPCPVPIKKELATLMQRIEILDWYHNNGKNQTVTARHFDPIYPNLQLKQPTISDWVKNETKWREQWAECRRESDRAAKRCRQTEHPEITEMMDLWVSKAMDDKVMLTGGLLRQKWTEFADQLGIPMDERLHLSAGWLDKVKARNGLKEFRRQGDAVPSSLDTAGQERTQSQELIKEYGHDPNYIFNMNGIELFYVMPHDAGISDKPQPDINLDF